MAVSGVVGLGGFGVEVGAAFWVNAILVLLAFAFTYNVSCTANKALSDGDSNVKLFAAHYVAISAQIKEMKADISAMRKEMRDMTKILYEREGVMLPPTGDPLNLPIGFAD